MSGSYALVAALIIFVVAAGFASVGFAGYEVVGLVGVFDSAARLRCQYFLVARPMQFPTKLPIALEDRTKFEERLTHCDPEVGISAPVLKSRLSALKAAPAKQTSYFWLTYGSADGLIGAVIMQASKLMRARTTPLFRASPPLGRPSPKVTSSALG